MALGLSIFVMLMGKSFLFSVTEEFLLINWKANPKIWKYLKIFRSDK